MRRPPFCLNVDVDNDALMTCTDMIGSLAEVAACSSRPRQRRVFGVPLEVLSPTGVPFIVTRLCHFIEVNGRATEGLFRTSCRQKALSELRNRFELTGDADLEGGRQVCSAACLLKTFLRELPKSVIPQSQTADFIQGASPGKEDVAALADAVWALAPSHRRLLKFLIGFLVRVTAYEEHTRMGALALGVVFGPCLFRVSEGHAVKEQATVNRVVTSLITHHDTVFGGHRRPIIARNSDIEENVSVEGSGFSTIGEIRRLTDLSSSLSDVITENLIGSVVIDSDSDRTDSRKRKDDMTVTTCGRKIIRSYSAEGPLEELPGRRSQLRRFASHEDVSQQSSCDTTASTSSFAAIIQEDGEPLRPMQLYVADSPSSTSSDDSPITPPPVFSPEDDLHESRRLSERLDNTYFNQNRRDRRRRRKQFNTDEDDSTKENDAYNSTWNPRTMKHKWGNHSGYYGDESDSDQPEKISEEVSAVGATSLAHLFTSDLEPPLVSRTTGGGGQTAGNADEDVVLSPRNSLTVSDHPYLDPRTSPGPYPSRHELHQIGNRAQSSDESNQAKIHHLTKHINSLKRRVRQYEESYERERGYRPSHADKMRCREVKRQLSELTKARKELKLLKEDLRSCGAVLSLSPAANVKPFTESKAKVKARTTTTLEDTVADISKRLEEKRDAADRAENVEEMTREEVLEEKVALQKALLYLEGLHGRPTRRDDRDAVRPLYERYRLIKRILLKSGSPKSRDSVSELTTILEHEAMDFSTMPRSLSADEAGAGPFMVLSQEPFNKREADLPSLSTGRLGDLGENLHSLPIEDLEKQHVQVKENKRQLRRTLREFEDDFLRRTGRRVQREDRSAVESTYREYKQVKAMLRLLDALLAKHET